MKHSVAFLVALLGACGGPSAQETTTAPSSAATDPSPSTDPAPAAQPTTPPVAPGPAPTIALTGAPSTSARDVAISVTNRGGSTAELRTSMALEVEHDGVFGPTQQTSLTLRYDCAQEPSTCVTLAPGAELIPPAWFGTWGDAQCVCTRCGPVEAGTYRFVATTCDGAHRIEGTPFTITR
jgi:hypothetical protein